MKAPAIAVPGARRTSITSLRFGIAHARLDGRKFDPGDHGKVGKAASGPAARPAWRLSPQPATVGHGFCRDLRAAACAAFFFSALASAFQSVLPMPAPLAGSLSIKCLIVQHRRVNPFARAGDRGGVGQLRRSGPRSPPVRSRPPVRRAPRPASGCRRRGFRSAGSGASRTRSGPGRTTSPGFSGDDGIFERLHHHAQAEPAQIAAIGRRAGVGRIGLGQFGEIGAAVDLRSSAPWPLPRCRPGYARRCIRSAGAASAYLRVIGRLQRLVGHGARDDGLASPRRTDSRGARSPAMMSSRLVSLPSTDCASAVCWISWSRMPLNSTSSGSDWYCSGRLSRSDDHLAQRDVGAVHGGHHRLGGLAFGAKPAGPRQGQRHQGRLRARTRECFAIFTFS